MTPTTAQTTEGQPDWRLEGARLLPCAVLATLGEPALAAAGLVPILVFAYWVLWARRR